MREAQCPNCEVDYAIDDPKCPECDLDYDDASEVRRARNQERTRQWVADERAKAEKLRTMDDTKECWAIVFGQAGQDLWWRENGRGYTTRIGEAGLFTERRANEQDRCERSSGCDRAIPPERFREMLERELPRLEAEVVRIREMIALLRSST